MIGVDLDGRNVRWCQEARNQRPRIERGYYGQLVCVDGNVAEFDGGQR